MMSRRSRRSSTAASSMATSVAIRQDRDAGAVKRLMSGKILAPAVRGSTATMHGPASAIPFTCYRCGQSLTGSLEDNSHPCLSMNIELTEDKPITNRHGRRERSLVQESLGPKLTNSELDDPAPSQVSVAATPSSCPRPNRSTREPRTVEQVRSDLVKRGLPGSNDNDPSKRRRRKIDHPSNLLVNDLTSHEAQPQTNTSFGAVEHQPVAAPSIHALPAPVGRAQGPPCQYDTGTRLTEEGVLSAKTAVTAPITGSATVATVLGRELRDAINSDGTTSETECPTKADEGESTPAAIATDVPRRRSRRGSTLVASKAAASLAYQERHKAKIMRSIQSCIERPATAPENKSTIHVGSWSRKKASGHIGHQVNSNTDRQYEVELVRAYRHNQDGTLEYLVVWKGYPASDATWEPAANLADLDSDLFAFSRAEVYASDQTDGSKDKSDRIPAVRSTGELNATCQRCHCLGCGTRRVATKGETTRRTPRQSKSGTRSIVSDAGAAASSGKDSWPVDLLGPKPSPPYCTGLGAEKSLDVAPVIHSRKHRKVPGVPSAAIASGTAKNHHPSATPGTNSRVVSSDTDYSVTYSTEAGGTKSNNTVPHQTLPFDLPLAVAQSLRGLGPCEKLEKGKLPAGWLRRDPLLASFGRVPSHGSTHTTQASDDVASRLRRFLGKLEPKRDGTERWRPIEHSASSQGDSP